MVSSIHFNFNGEEIIDLVSWKFDDEVSDDPNETNWVEISLNMSDGSIRWCILYTPERLSNLLQQPNLYPTGLHIKHMIVVKSYNKEVVQIILDYLNQEDELIDATLLLSANGCDYERKSMNKTLKIVDLSLNRVLRKPS